MCDASDASVAAAAPTNRLALLNCPVLTVDGTYHVCTLTLERAQGWVDTADTVESFIGHESTAATLATILKRPVAVNRASYKQGVGEDALVFTLNARQKEGVVLSEADIAAVGYTLKLLHRDA